MPSKTTKFLTKTQASARTARWSWVLLWFWRGLFRLIIDPIPTAQNTVPARKPLRVFAFWKLCFAKPRHLWRSTIQVLMQPNVVIEKRELNDGLIQPRGAVDLNLANGSFEGAEESLNATIAPRRMRRYALMPNAQTLPCQREIERNERAIVVKNHQITSQKPQQCADSALALGFALVLALSDQALKAMQQALQNSKVRIIYNGSK